MPEADVIKRNRMPVFNVLRNRNFLMLLMNDFFATFTRSMQSVIIGWWVLQLTNSPLALGVVFAWSRLSRWLGPVFGVLADRYDKRKTMIVLNMGNLALYLIMGILASSGSAQLWHIVVFFMLLNVSVTATTPVRNPLIHDLLGEEGVLNGLALLSFPESTIAAPVAGLLYNSIGVDGLYYLLTVLCAIGILPLFMIKIPKTSTKEVIVKRESMVKLLLEGFKYIWKDRTILAILTITSLWNLLIFPYNSQLSVMARDVLGVGVAGLGILTGAVSIGQLVASFFLATLVNLKRKGLVAIFASAMIGIFLLSFSISRWYPLSLALLFGLGMMQMVQMTVTHTLLLTYVPITMRGRVLGVRMQVGGGAMISIGSLMVGMLANNIGVPFALGLIGTIFGSSVMIIALLQPKLRKLK
jgi:MFS family permease